MAMTRQDAFDPVMTEISQRFLGAGEVTEDEKAKLEKWAGHPMWSDMCQTRLVAQAHQHEQRRIDSRAALIAECLSPIPVPSFANASQQALMLHAERQTRLLVEILKELTERKP